jgi:regulator of sirC expression with transglutaminase-like and TPR domain
MLVAQQLKIPIYGVNLPNLFILTYKSDEAHFYINAANKGLIFGKKDIDDYMEKLQLKPRPQFYEPCTNLEMVQRFLRNLILSFEQVQESEKVEEIKMLLVAISK